MDGTMLHYLGQACRDARVAAALRQIEIATTARTTHATISRFETGKAWPMQPDVVIAAYATELGIEPVELWSDALTRWRAEGVE